MPTSMGLRAQLAAPCDWLYIISSPSGAELGAQSRTEQKATLTESRGNADTLVSADGLAGPPMAKLLKWRYDFGTITIAGVIGLWTPWHGYESAAWLMSGDFEGMCSCEHTFEGGGFERRFSALGVYPDPVSLSTACSERG